MNLYEAVLASVLEWFPVQPTGSGHLAGLAGLLLVRERKITKGSIITGLITSSVLAVSIGWWANYEDEVIGGLLGAALSIIGLFALFFLKLNLLAVEEGRPPDVMDAFVSGFAQGVSTIGFGGTGLSIALLTSSGVNFKDAILLSSITSIPVALITFRPTTLSLIQVALGVLVSLSLYRIDAKAAKVGLMYDLLILMNLNQVWKVQEKMEFYRQIEEEVVSWVKKYGGPGVFMAMVAQSVISPIPADAVLVAAGALGLPPIEVGLYGGLGIVIGSMVNYGVGRMFGKRLLDSYFKEEFVEEVHRWFDKWGGWIVFFSRLIPFLPIDLISYVAGATYMNPFVFFMSNLLAVVPRAMFFGYVGEMLMKGKWEILVAALALIVGGALIGYKVQKGRKGSEGPVAQQG